MVRLLVTFLLVFVFTGCGGKGSDTKDPEGVNAGDCSDGADNDADGKFDCDDSGCKGSPDCAEADADTDTDTDSDTDTDTPPAPIATSWPRCQRSLPGYLPGKPQIRDGLACADGARVMPDPENEAPRQGWEERRERRREEENLPGRKIVRIGSLSGSGMQSPISPNFHIFTLPDYTPLVPECKTQTPYFPYRFAGNCICPDRATFHPPVSSHKGDDCRAWSLQAAKRWLTLVLALPLPQNGASSE